MNIRETTVSAVLDGNSEKSLSLVITGRFNYQESYAAFQKDTTQLEDTARIIGIFVDRLKKYRFFQKEKELVNVADIGCNDGVACLRYLKTISDKPKFNYFGIDIEETSLQKTGRLLLSCKIINKLILIKGDAFDGKIRQKKEFAAAPFDLIFVSHSAYYVKRQRDPRSISEHTSFILDISNLLSKNGVAILVHGNSFYSLRKRYGVSDARDTPYLLEQAMCSSDLNQLQSVKFTSRLNFIEMDDSLWDAMKYPDKYILYKNHFNFVDTLEKISFIINFDFIDMEKKGILPKFIDEIKEIITKNDHAFPITSSLQVIVSPHCSLTHKIAKALQETEDEILHSRIREGEHR